MTGDVGKCTAWLRECHYEDQSEHFDSPGEARSAVEKAYEGIGYRFLVPVKMADTRLRSSVEEFTQEIREKSDGASYRDGRKKLWEVGFSSLSSDVKRELFFYWNEEHSKILNEMLWKKKFPDELDSEAFESLLETVEVLDTFISEVKEEQELPVYKGVSFGSKIERSIILDQLKRLPEGSMLGDIGLFQLLGFT